MKYLLFLRGINVGGKHLVKMESLRQQIQALGYPSVKTYINSGNIVLESEQDIQSIKQEIKQCLQQSYEFEILFSIIEQESLRKEYLSLPLNDFVLKRKDILFYTDHCKMDEIMEYVQNHHREDEWMYIGKHALYLGITDQAEFLKTSYQKSLLKTSFYPFVTIRNEKTVRIMLQL